MPPRSAVHHVSSILDDAYSIGASDVHFDPVALGMRVRFRVDGRLSEQAVLPCDVRDELIARVKVLAGLRTDEHLAAQDGRFRYRSQDGMRYADVRVSIAPTYHGENAVLRLLTDRAQDLSLEVLGFAAYDRGRILRALEKPDGMILITGPTGSGKTTTLYALMRLLHKPETALVTIEDPIEYAMEGVRQVQTQARTGLTFAQGLRAVLRQDPDIIMVGEIRDEETARVAMHTALTGHLLLSTLHTNDAVSALPRLYDLGIEPYLIASTLRLIVAQRLVRARCIQCQTGCIRCDETGFRGRAVVAETLLIDEPFREAILSRASADQLFMHARAAGMRSMREDGLLKIQEGITTPAELADAI